MYLLLATMICLSITACDPACDGSMKIINNTDSTLSIIISKKGDFRKSYLVDIYNDSIECRTEYKYEFNDNSISTLYGDTLLIVECNLPKNNEFEIYYEGPLGTLYLDSKESALHILNDILDTLYIKNVALKKELKNMENWEISVDKYNNGGGESLFEFVIENENIE